MSPSCGGGAPAPVGTRSSPAWTPQAIRRNSRSSLTSSFSYTVTAARPAAPGTSARTTKATAETVAADGRRIVGSLGSRSRARSLSQPGRVLTRRWLFPDNPLPMSHAATSGPGPAGTNGGFRWRSREITRVEGFSDAVFAFAVTLLVVSLEVPQTFHELRESMDGFVAFALGFALLFWIWFQQYLFFRRFGLTDGWT